MRQTEKGFTRRGFLTGSALALGGVAISAMGCAPAQKEPESKPATDEPTGDPSYVDPWAGHYAADWADKVTETVDTDLVIVHVRLPSADRRRRKGRRHGDGRPDHPE